MQPHIQCERVSELVLLPGDPKRVDRVAKYLDNPKLIADNREFRTIIGSYKGVEITVTSTGIGGASAVIALEELINCGGKYFIRIGSAGATQKDIKIGELIIPSSCVREDGASNMYVNKEYPATASIELVTAIIKNLEKLKYEYHVGITRSHDSFYIDEEKEKMTFWSKKNVLGSDMETASIFVVGSLRGVHVASILNNVVLFEEELKDSINEYENIEGLAKEGEKREIILALESLKEINNTKKHIFV